MRYFLFLLFFSHLSISRSLASSEIADDQQKAIKFSFTYLGDFVGCFYGGIDNGSTYMGLLDLSAGFNSSALKFWKGGDFLIEFQNTHNGTPSEDMVGDLQVFDNIENGNHTYLYQLWYRQQIGKFWFLTGLHDLNSEFLMSDYSCEYLNSSFGIMPVTSLNTPVSIFPKTALAFISGFSSGRYDIKAGIYEGDPGSLDEDPYNMDISLNLQQGVFGILEASIRHNVLGNKKGIIKLGAALHSGDNHHIFDSTHIYQSNYNYYLIADQEITHEENSEDEGLGLLLQLGAAPSKRNLNDFFLAMGFNYTGLIKHRDSDILGFAVAHASISRPYIKATFHSVMPAETVFELSYKLVFKHIFLQPNLQYIINPGINPLVRNAGVAILRIGINY